MSSTAAAVEDPTDGLTSSHKLKLKPPTFDGSYNNFEEWSYKFTAYMGLQDAFYPRMFRLAEQATQPVTEQHLRTAASTLEEADHWVQLDTNLKYILINVTTGSAATLCRQFQHEIGLEILRQMHNRYALPVGTRSIGYLTKLLKPTLDPNNFEESFSNWEFDVNRYEKDNNATLPDQVKIAILKRDQRTSATTLTTECQQHTHIQRPQAHHDGVLSNNTSLQQDATGIIKQCCNEPRRRPGTNGHRSHQQG